jgi:hypothetical protein
MPLQQREMRHNAEQPSHASRWVPSYMGQCIIGPTQLLAQNPITAFPEVETMNGGKVEPQISPCIKAICLYELKRENFSRYFSG